MAIKIFTNLDRMRDEFVSFLMMNIFRTFSLVGIACLLSVPAVAKPAKAFSKLPSLDGKGSGLKIKTLAYDGSTNGTMHVKIKNTTKKIQVFDPTGLFFVPDMDPKNAPQRLGAAGPYDIKTGSKWQEARKTHIAPGATVEARLALFCIDSQRPSPSSSTPFRIAKKRMPKQLRKELAAESDNALRGKNSYKDAEAKSAVQSKVWETRDKKWIKLEGETKRDSIGKGSRRRSRGQVRRQRRGGN